MNQIERRGEGIREALKGEQPVVRNPFVFVCSWCPDSYEKTLAARKRGRDASHGICPSCEARLFAEMEADPRRV